MRGILFLLVLSLIVTTCRKDAEDPADPPAEGDHNTKPDPAKSPTSEPLRVVQISAGGYHNCALLSDGRVKCWGGDTEDNSEGGRKTSALGQGSGNENIGDGKKWNKDTGQPEPTDKNEMGDNLKAVDLGSGVKAKAISSGSYHTCALLTDGKVKCWGQGWAGMLGQGNTDTLGDEPDEMGDKLKPIDLGTGRTAKAIAAGLTHNCALLDNDTVKCWGEGKYGRLGQGNENDIGDGENEMGDNLKAVNLGNDVKATAITAGVAHTCALLDSKKVKCWGGGQQGRLGHNSEEPLGDETKEVGNGLPAVNLGDDVSVVAIATGSTHNCALLDSGALKCWGHGGNGQLGQGNTERLGDGKDKDLQNSDKDEMGDNLKAVNLGNNVKIKAIALGSSLTCALLTDGTVKCWGANSKGQLGQGHTYSAGIYEDEMGDNLPFVELGSGVKATAITAGYRHTCALLDNHRVKCWGNGAGGLLGQGNEDNLGDEGDKENEEKEMGDDLPYVDILGSEK